MFDVASRTGLLPNLDRTARLETIAGASSHGICARVFINSNPSSVYDPNLCLRRTLEAVKRSGLSPEKIGLRGHRERRGNRRQASRVKSWTAVARAVSARPSMTWA